jgi:hypothetical protein
MTLPGTECSNEKLLRDPAAVSSLGVHYTCVCPDSVGDFSMPLEESVRSFGGSPWATIASASFLDLPKYNITIDQSRDDLLFRFILL